MASVSVTEDEERSTCLKWGRFATTIIGMSPMTELLVNMSDLSASSLNETPRRRLSLCCSASSTPGIFPASSEVKQCTPNCSQSVQFKVPKYVTEESPFFQFSSAEKGTNVKGNARPAVHAGCKASLWSTPLMMHGSLPEAGQLPLKSSPLIAENFMSAGGEEVRGRRTDDSALREIPGCSPLLPSPVESTVPGLDSVPSAAPLHFNRQLLRPSFALPARPNLPAEEPTNINVKDRFPSPPNTAVQRCCASSTPMCSPDSKASDRLHSDTGVFPTQFQDGLHNFELLSPVSTRAQVTPKSASCSKRCLIDCLRSGALPESASSIGHMRRNLFKPLGDTVDMISASSGALFNDVTPPGSVFKNAKISSSVLKDPLLSGPLYSDPASSGSLHHDSPSYGSMHSDSSSSSSAHCDSPSYGSMHCDSSTSGKDSVSALSEKMDFSEARSMALEMGKNDDERMNTLSRLEEHVDSRKSVVENRELEVAGSRGAIFAEDTEEAHNDNTASCDLAEIGWVTHKESGEPAYNNSEEAVWMTSVWGWDGEQRSLIGDLTIPYALPLVCGKHPDLKAISPDTMAQVVAGHFNNILDNILIIDCRYPYEFTGGHIKGAKNVYCPGDLIEKFFPEFPNTCPAGLDSSTRSVLVFHCEFSSERAPKMLRLLRKKDRDLNHAHYPRLNFPEVYVLEGGYKAFFESHPELCEPPTYVPMVHSDYCEDLRKFRAKARSYKEQREKLALYRRCSSVKN